MALYFPESFLQEVMDRNDIVDVISKYVTLKRSGSSLKGLCPFHHEKTPSFNVSSDKQMFYCFGCHKGGTVINFVMQMENLDFVEAVTLLAEKSGLAIPTETGNKQQNEEKHTIYKINADTARYFYNNLNSPCGDEANEYINKRKLNHSTIIRFGLGFAPNNNGLIAYLKEKGYNDEMIVKSGVTGKSEDGRIYSRFRNRLMFPIIDVRKNIIGFGGRVMDDSLPKYLNSPETAAFNKSYNLYGLNFAKNTKENFLVLVEGYMDVISLHQAGIDSAVATLGTALTPEQARVIRRLKSEVILCYDSDEPGQKATRRAIEILVDEGLSVKVITVPGSKDPDEFIKTNGSGAFKELIKKSQVQIEYKINKIKEKYHLHDTSDKINYINEIATELIKLKSPVEREIYITKISEETGVSTDSITSEVNRLIANIKNKQKFTNFTPRIQDVKSTSNLEKKRYEEAQKLILNILSYKSELGKNILEKLSTNDFSDGALKIMFNEISSRIEKNDSINPQILLSEFNDIPVAIEILSVDQNVEDYNLAATQAVNIIKKYVSKQKMLAAINDSNSSDKQKVEEINNLFNN